MATNILMPALSPTMEEGKLSKWLVKEGDTVKSGDILAEIETDKATMEFEAVDEGKIGKILVPEGTEGVKVNAPIAVLLRRWREGGRGRYSRRDERHRCGGKGRTRTESRYPDPGEIPSPERGSRTGTLRRRQTRIRFDLWPNASPPARASTFPPCRARARADASSSRMWRMPSRAPRSPPLPHPPPRAVAFRRASRRCRMRNCSTSRGLYRSPA